MMIRGRLCPPSYDAVRQGTIFIPDTEDPEYPHANLALDDPAWVVKSTTNEIQIQVSTPGPVTLLAASLHNTNAETADITSDSGLSQAITIPAQDVDGQRLGAWVDVAGLPFTTDDLFAFNLARASGVVWVGRVSLWLAVRTVNWEAGRGYGVIRPGDVHHRTRLGSVVHDAQRLRQRWWEMTFSLAEDAPAFRELEASSMGAILPFALVPDETVNDAAWVYTPEAYKETLGEPRRASIPRRFLELVNGPIDG